MLTIYAMPQVITVVTQMSGALMNFPVDNDSFKLFKGLTNTIWVYVKDVDRNVVVVPNTSTLQISIVDHNSQTLAYSGALTLIDSTTGRYSFTVQSSDIGNWTSHTYTYSILLTDGAGNTSPLFTDRGYSLSGDVQIMPGPLPLPPTATVLPNSSFLTLNNALISGPYPGAAQKGNLAGVHTVAVYGTQFSGLVTVQGSLDSQPGDWFDVYSYTGVGLNGIDYFNVVGNYLWLQFKVETSQGTFNQIIFRN